MNTNTIKMRAGGYRHEVTEVEHAGRLYFKFGYAKKLMEEIKALEGARWEGPIGEQEARCPPDVARALGGAKAWSVPISQHNLFQLEYLKGGDPYKWYDQKIIEHEINARPNGLMPYAHQKALTNFFLTVRQCVASAEQGVGKSLATICAVEIVKPKGVWWISSGSGVAAVRAELKKWGANFTPQLMTYNGMLKLVKQHQEGMPLEIPQFIVFDEAHKVKTHTSQRSQAAAFLADAIRTKYGKDGYVILMTGTPAPNNPTDWWHLCRVACPGFLREGTWEKFRNRLGVIVARENQVTGGMFPQLLSWKDKDNICEVCGKTKETHDIHQTPEEVLTAHPFQPCINEVAKLYKRMHGLVIRQFKKDCLDLPDMQYKIIRCKPSPDMVRAAKLINARSRRVIEKITLLRELSDGFQYQEVQGEEIKCPNCREGKVMDFVEIEEGTEEFEEREVDCYTCDGTGKSHRITRVAKYLPTAKEQALRQQLELHEDCGRLVVYAGFTGSIDRIVEIAQSEKWATIKWDGRGIVCRDDKGAIIKSEPLTMFQEMLEQYPRVCFIGHPESSGEGITLTKSPSIVFYSNDFNFKSRDQAEARIHRLGMDVNRGATIIDLVCLETDEMILRNLKAKKRLQTMTLTGLDFDDKDDRIFDVE